MKLIHPLLHLASMMSFAKTLSVGPFKLLRNALSGLREADYFSIGADLYAASSFLRVIVRNDNRVVYNYKGK